ncbi:MAG: porin family protein [Bacteroidota bacterium]|nr:porin family protein [Bacteroidota bacterium]
MKKVLIVAFILISNLSFSQKFGGGILGGMAVSQLDGDSWGGYHKAGLYFGVFTNAKLNKKFWTQLELAYIQKGSKSNSKEPNYVYYKCKLNYIQMPLLLKYNINNKINAEIGIAEGFLRNAYEDDGGGDIEPDIAFDKWETSVIIGASYKFTDRINANVRINYSLIPIRNHPGGQSFWLNNGQYNNVLSFSLYYKIVDAED